MDYVIECRPSRELLTALEKAGQIDLMRLFTRLVYFARSMSLPDGPDRDEVKPMLEEVVAEFGKSLPDNLQIDVEEAFANKGSVVIVILVSVAAAPAAATGVAVGGGVLFSGLALWAADKLFGGALEEAGKVLLDKLKEKFSNWFKKKGKEPPAMPVVNPREIAEGEAAKVASQHGCRPAIMSGGIAVGEHSYQYVYDLHGCRHKLLTITVDSLNAKTPVQVAVT